MSIHGLVAAVRRVACELAGIQKSHEPRGKFIGDSGLLQHCRYIFLVEVFGSDVHLVGCKSEQRLVKFLIKSRIQILLEISGCHFQTSERHFGRFPVLVPDDIGTTRLHTFHEIPQQPCDKQYQCCHNPVPQ